MLGGRVFFPLSGQVLGLQLLGAVVIWLLASSCSLADRIVLTDGDIIEGVITKQGRSSVILEHHDLGSMEIPRIRIKSLTIDAPNVQVVLASGDMIQGRLVEESDSTIVLEHPDLGRTEIPRDRIDSLKVKESEFKKDEQEGWLDQPLGKLNARASRLKKKGWESSVDLSLDSSTGNTDEQSARFGSHFKRELPDRITAADLSYYIKSKRGWISDNKLTLGLGRDWLLPEKSRLFYFLQGRFDYDEFESWQQRANAQAGPGYHFINKDDMTLDGRLGLGARREWGSINNNFKFEGLIGADFEWRITSKQICKFAPYYYPVVSDFGDYRTRISGEWRYLFDEDMRLSFLVGSLYEFQSIVDPGKEHADLRVYLGLGYRF
jgi:putative salt-induced outer membrane protein YdiY